MESEYNIYIRNLQEYYKLMDQLLHETIEPLMVQIKMVLLKGQSYQFNRNDEINVRLYEELYDKINENILNLKEFSLELTENEDDDLRDFCNWYDTLFTKVEKFYKVIGILKNKETKVEDCKFRGFNM